MIVDYALPWSFIKRHLPTRVSLSLNIRTYIISRYCSHRNATLDTLLHLLEWSPDYNPIPFKESFNVNLASNIAKTGRRDILEFIINRYPNINLSNVIDEAAKHGGDLAVWLMKTFKQLIDYPPRLALLNAANHGNLSVIEYFHQLNNHCQFTTNHMDYASRNGHLEIVKFLHFNRSEGCTQSAIDNASEGGFLDIVMFLHHNRTEGCSKSAFNNASRNGHFEIVKFLHFNRTEGCSFYAMDGASTFGSLDIVKFLHFNRTEGCSKEAMDKCSKLEIIQFLHFNRTEGATTQAMNKACERGDLDTVSFLYQNRSEKYSSIAIDNASKNGHLNILKFLEFNKILEYNILTMIGLVIQNNCKLEILEFLYHHVKKEENVPPSSKEISIENAILNDRLDIIQFLYHHYPKLISTSNAIQLSVKYGKTEILKFLFQETKNNHLLLPTSAMDTASQNGHLEMVKYLHSKNNQCTTNAMDMASSNGHLNIVQWLHQNRSEGPTKMAMEYSLVQGRVQVAQFLRKHYPRESKRIRQLDTSIHSITNYVQYCKTLEYIESINIKAKIKIVDINPLP
ncbi:hypothetical protein DFA_03876 [Cavenderia fasciculata]|uniref:Ankyrin repeat-containing protein n=1 Tax=Cavenderia fasciculata TaxID=261658 RepID=F4Q0N1_CACFS|nr:uncharacterized protein DFA_03876 [Cavenderia fasciculata]EGG18382.1 hypothetical protein DFA_03876 [Cavenderia fasciculata]|eukprot:XP_004366286.1 hypothetical protein DFA_03876 [Cavenderia fasciculata]